MTTEPMLFFSRREEWRAWLEQNHAHVKVAWLVYYNTRFDGCSIDHESTWKRLCVMAGLHSITKKPRRSTPYAQVHTAYQQAEMVHLKYFPVIFRWVLVNT